MCTWKKLYMTSNNLKKYIKKYIKTILNKQRFKSWWSKIFFLLIWVLSEEKLKKSHKIIMINQENMK
jgi:hypothetical protein